MIEVEATAAHPKIDEHERVVAAKTRASIRVAAFAEGRTSSDPMSKFNAYAIASALSVLLSVTADAQQMEVARPVNGTTYERLLHSDDPAFQKSLIELDVSEFMRRLDNATRNRSARVSVHLTHNAKFTLTHIHNTTAPGDPDPNYTGLVVGGGGFSVVFDDNAATMYLDDNEIQYHVSASVDGLHLVMRVDPSLLPPQPQEPEVEPSQPEDAPVRSKGRDTE